MEDLTVNQQQAQFEAQQGQQQKALSVYVKDKPTSLVTY
jgi:hypothetical protein